MTPQRTTSRQVRLAAIAATLLIAFPFTTTARAAADPPDRACVTLLAVQATPAVAGPLAEAERAVAIVDRSARQIVMAHPIVPTPSIAWPALLGVAFIAHRVLRRAPRSTARMF